MSYASEVLADSPTIYLRLDETSGTSATDSSGNSNTGTYSGQYTLNQASLVGSDLTGKSVKMSNSSGTAGQIQVPVVTLGMTWTIEMVIKPVSGDGTAGEQCLFIARSGSNLNNAVWIVYDNGGQRVLMYGSISDGSNCYSGVWVGSVAPNVITHVAAVLDGSAARLYINGVEGAYDDTLNGTISITSSTTDGAFAFGAPFSGAYPNIFGGYLDELAIYSGSYLSAARVAAHYAALAAPVSAQGFLPPSTRGTVRAIHFPVNQLRL